MCLTLSVIQINTDGTSNAHQVLSDAPKEAHVLFLQDISMTGKEVDNFTKHAATKGWSAYGTGGYDTEKNKIKGGVMTLARKELNQRLIWKTKVGKATVLFAWIEGWTTGNGYAPPYEDELDNLAIALGEGMAAAKIEPGQENVVYRKRLQV